MKTTHSLSQCNVQRLLVVGCLALLHGVAFGQQGLPAGAPDPAEQLRRDEERNRLQRQQLEGGAPVPPRPEAAQAERLPAQETPCWPITRITLEDADGFAGLAAAAAGPKGADPPLGRCLGSQGVALVVKRLQDHLIQEGFITTRILVPAQDLSGGTLRLRVLAGRIGSVARTPGTGPDADNSAAVPPGLPLHVGDILDLRAVEQAIENLRRVPSAEADIAIEPGTQPQTSDLRLTYRQSKPWRLLLGADDSGTRATGRYLGSATLSWDNPLGLNDLLYLTLNNDLGGGDPGSRGTRGHTVHYSLPWTYWTIGFTTLANRYYQSVVGANQSYIYQGTSETLELSAARVIQRDNRGKTDLRIKAFQRRSNNYVDDTEIMVQRRVVGGWEAGLGRRQSWQAQGAPVTLETNLALRRGTGDFDTLPAPEEASGEGTSRFGLVLLDASLNWPWRIASQSGLYTSSVRIQNNTTALSPQDRFAIGTRYTVRGFDGESVLSAERGWTLRQDFALNWGSSARRAYLGLDYGEVSGPSSELLAGKALAGAVLGLRATWGRLQYDVFVGTPLHKPSGFRAPSTTGGFQASLSF